MSGGQNGVMLLLQDRNDQVTTVAVDRIPEPRGPLQKSIEIRNAVAEHSTALIPPPPPTGHRTSSSIWRRLLAR